MTRETRRKIEKALFLLTAIIVGFGMIVWTRSMLEPFLGFDLFMGINVGTALGILFLYLFYRYWTKQI